MISNKENVFNCPPRKFFILYADDHQLVRLAISEYINDFEKFFVAKTFENGKQLVDTLSYGDLPEIVIVDLDMPIMNGYETTCWLKKNYPNVLVVILTVFNNEYASTASFEVGADAFCSKDICPREMEALLLRLVDGEKQIEPSPSLSFTPLEKQLIALLCTEKTYEEMAGLLNSSLRNKERLREILFKKMHVNNRTSLAVKAVRFGLV